MVTRIYGDASTAGDWPLAVPAAIRHRDIGYVPHLVDHCASAFFSGQFGYSIRDRLKLNTEMRASLEVAIRDLSPEHDGAPRRDRIAVIMKAKGKKASDAVTTDELLATLTGKHGAWLYGETSGAAHGSAPTRTDARTLFHHWCALMRSLVL